MTKPEHQDIYNRYGVPAEAPKPRKLLPGWAKFILASVVLIGGIAAIFQVNPVCGIGLFLLIPIMTNL